MPSNDTLSVIKDAETKAASVREGALNAARGLVSDATAKNEKRISEAAAKIAASKKDALEKIGEEADRRVREECLDADFEAQRLASRASKHMPAAVRYICREIREKCQ